MKGGKYSSWKWQGRNIRSKSIILYLWCPIPLTGSSKGLAMTEMPPALPVPALPSSIGKPFSANILLSPLLIHSGDPFHWWSPLIPSLLILPPYIHNKIILLHPHHVSKPSLSALLYPHIHSTVHLLAIKLNLIHSLYSPHPILTHHMLLSQT